MTPTPTATSTPSPAADSLAAEALLAQLSDGVLVLRLDTGADGGPDFVVLQANAALSPQAGLDAQAGQRLNELLPTLRHSDAALFERMLRVARTGRGETFEGPIAALGGSFKGQLIGTAAGRLVVTFSRQPAADRRQADAEAQLAEQRAILDSNLVGLVRTRQRRITWANAAAESLFGYTLAELLGQSTEKLYPSKEAFERFAETALPLVRAGQVYRGETLVRRKDGQLRWFSHQVTELAPGSENHVSSFIDITDRVKAQQALMRSEARLSSTFAAMAEGMVLHGADGRIIEANPAAEHILGLTRDQLLGRDSLDPRWQATYEDGTPWPGRDHPGMQALRSGQPQRERVMGIVAPGRGQRWISVNADPVLYPGQPHPAGVVATFSDITERRGIEEQLAASLEELRDLYDNAPCGYHSLDAQGRVLHINTTELAWIGCTRDEIIGRPIGPFLGPQGQELFERHFPRLRERDRVCGVEFDLVGRQGEVRRVSVISTVVRNPQGQFLRTRTILHDITALQRAEQVRLDTVRLQAENAQMRETNRVKSLFIASMSHELKTPLNAVLGVVQMLEMGLVKPGTTRFNRYVAQLGSSGRQLARLIENILDHASLEAGRMDFKPRPVDPERLLRKVVEILRPEIEHKQLALTVMVDPQLGPLCLDPLRLQQVCAHYLDNAVKFTASGGHVAVRLRPEGPAEFSIEVEDTGIGIAEADLDSLFVEFHQLSSGSTKEYSGTGLGLALTRRLVESQGGRVGVRSEPGVGSVFHAVLPRDARPGNPAEATAP